MNSLQLEPIPSSLKNSSNLEEGPTVPSDNQGIAPAHILMLAMWFGILTGYGEVIILGIAKFIMHEVHILHTPHFVWMSPLANWLLFLLLSIPLCLWAWKQPGQVTKRVVICLFAFLSILGLLSLFPRISDFSIFLLSVGLAFQVMRVITGNRWEAIEPLIRGSLIGLLALALLSFGILKGWEHLQEHRAIANLPAAKASSPNIILIVLDTVRAQSLSLYGYKRDTTPRLKEFAKTGILFNHAYSTAPWTLPSTASMFTGRAHHQLSTEWRVPLDTTFPTLAETLQQHGYLTAGFVANLEYCSYVYGLNRGFIHYEDFVITPGELAVSSSLIRKAFGTPNYRIFPYYELLNRKSADIVNGNFLSWLSSQRNQPEKGSRPFFAFLNYFDAHEPYIPPDDFLTDISSQSSTKPFADLWHKYTVKDVQQLRTLYEDSIAYLDSQVGALLDGLKARGLLDNTLIIITSDHGEEFSEHGIPSHGHSLYTPSLHVPLIISFPARLPKNVTIHESVSLKELPITIWNILIPDNSSIFPGFPLNRFWESDAISESQKPMPILSELNKATDLPMWFPVSEGNMKSIIFQGYHYITTAETKRELYDLATDPQETNDISMTPQGQALIPCFQDIMTSMLYTNQELKGISSPRNKDLRPTSFLSIRKPITPPPCLPLNSSQEINGF